MLETENRKGKTMPKIWWRIAFAAWSFVVFAPYALAGTVYVSFVMESNAHVQAEPSATARTLYSPPQLTVLEVVDRESQAEWLQVITPKGDRGWILKSSVIFQEEGTSDSSVAKKGVIDREFARKELLKLWQTTWKNATPLCDICNARVPRDTGYMLTTKQVLASRNYHEMLKRLSPGNYSQMIANFERDRTPWCVCESCIDKYFVDMPGSANPTELAVAKQANDDQRRRKLEAIKKQFTLEQVREKMKSGQVWFVEDPVQKNLIYPIIPTTVDEWILEAMEKEQEPKPSGSTGTGDKETTDPNAANDSNQAKAPQQGEPNKP